MLKKGATWLPFLMTNILFIVVYLGIYMPPLPSTPDSITDYIKTTMKTLLKSILIGNLTIAGYFILSYLNHMYWHLAALQALLSFIQELFIFVIAGLVLFSFGFAIYLLFQKEKLSLKLGILTLSSLNIFLTFFAYPLLP